MISAVLVCDGTSDFCIIDVLQWIADENFPDTGFRFLIAKEVVPAKGPLSVRLKRAESLYDPDLIICHRDAEQATLAQRIQEIVQAKNQGDVAKTVIPAVPVRMIESWLLFNENAIRAAANNKNGQTPLEIPPLKRLENLPDPKEALFTALKTASGLPPNRLRKFEEHKARARVTTHLDSFAPLRTLESFSKFENSFIEEVNRLQA
jgi:hypothetical protein